MNIKKRHKLYMLLGYVVLIFMCTDVVAMNKQHKQQAVSSVVESAYSINQHLETILDNAQSLVQQMENNTYDKSVSKNAIKAIEIAQIKLSPKIQEAIKPYTSLIKQETQAFSAQRKPLAKYNPASAQQALAGLVNAIKNTIDDTADSVVTDAHEKIQRAIAEMEKITTKATVIINNARMQLAQETISPVQAAIIIGEQNNIIDTAQATLTKITEQAQKNVENIDEQAGYWSNFVSGLYGFSAKIAAPLKAGYGYTQEQKNLAHAIIAELQQHITIVTIQYKKTIGRTNLDTAQKAQIDSAYNQTMQELNNEIYQQQLITGEVMSFERKLFWGSVAAAGIVGAAYLGQQLLSEEAGPLSPAVNSPVNTPTEETKPLTGDTIAIVPENNGSMLNESSAIVPEGGMVATPIVESNGFAHNSSSQTAFGDEVASTSTVDNSNGVNGSNESNQEAIPYSTDDQQQATEVEATEGNPEQSTEMVNKANKGQEEETGVDEAEQTEEVEKSGTAVGEMEETEDQQADGMSEENRLSEPEVVDAEEEGKKEIGGQELAVPGEEATDEKGLNVKSEENTKFDQRAVTDLTPEGEEATANIVSEGQKNNTEKQEQEKGLTQGFIDYDQKEQLLIDERWDNATPEERNQMEARLRDLDTFLGEDVDPNDMVALSNREKALHEIFDEMGRDPSAYPISYRDKQNQAQWDVFHNIIALEEKERAEQVASSKNEQGAAAAELMNERDEERGQTVDANKEEQGQVNIKELTPSTETVNDEKVLVGKENEKPGQGVGTDLTRDDEDVTMDTVSESQKNEKEEERKAEEKVQIADAERVEAEEKLKELEREEENKNDKEEDVINQEKKLENEEKEKNRTAIAQMSPDDFRNAGSTQAAGLKEAFNKSPVNKASQEVLEKSKENEEGFVKQMQELKQRALNTGNRIKETARETTDTIAEKAKEVAEERKETWKNQIESEKEAREEQRIIKKNNREKRERRSRKAKENKETERREKEERQKRAEEIIENNELKDLKQKRLTEM